MASGQEESIGDLAGRLMADARAYAEAEAAYYRLLAHQKGREAQTGLFLLLAAVLAATAAFVALPVGLILVLAPLLGSLWATVLVVAVLLSLTFVLGWLAFACLRRVFPR